MNYQTQLEQNKDAWLEGIKKGDSKGLELIYRAYRTEFIKWISHNTSFSVEMATDLFQESVLVLYKNVKAGKLEDLTSSIKTYLFAIGKRLYANHQRKQKIETKTLTVEDFSIKELAIMPKESNTLNERQELVSKLLNKMRYPCKDILTMFYYKGFSIKEIVAEMEYKSVNVIKVLKVRCMKSLRKMVFQQKK